MKKLDGIICDGCASVITGNPHKYNDKEYCNECNMNLHGYVNNFTKLEYEYLNFDYGQIYMIQLIWRKKDGGTDRVIKTLYLKSKSDLERTEAFIKLICDRLPVRAYIQLNPIHAKDICLNIAEKSLQLLKGNNCESFDSIVSSCAGSNYDKDYFVVDIDEKDYNKKELIKHIISQCRRNNKEFFADEIPTISGWHLVVYPFDVKQFNQLCLIEKIDNVEVKKQAMTLLYCDIGSI